MRLRMLFLFVIIYNYSNAQSLEPFVVANSGNSYSSSESSLSWTLGELSIKTLENETCALTQGFHQPNYNISPSENQELPELKLLVFPNPIVDEVQISSIHNDLEPYDFQILNVHGQMIMEKNNIHLPFSFSGMDLISGTYFLKIYKTHKRNQSNTFKIIKS